MDYQLKPLGKTCAVTGKPLVPGSVCHSVVVEKQGHFVRVDYSAEGWQGPPDDAIGHWVVDVPAAPNNGGRIDPEVLIRHFEILCEEADPLQEQARYVTALLLLKARRLKFDDSRRDEEHREWLILSGSRGEGPFEIPNLELPDEQLAALQQTLKASLAAEWQT